MISILFLTTLTRLFLIFKQSVTKFCIRLTVQKGLNQKIKQTIFYLKYKKTNTIALLCIVTFVEVLSWYGFGSVSTSTFLMQMVQEVGSALPSWFIQGLLGPSCRLLSLKHARNPKLSSELLALYQACLAVKSVPLLQTAYR